MQPCCMKRNHFPLIARIFVVAGGVFLESMFKSYRMYRRLSVSYTLNFRFTPMQFSHSVHSTYFTTNSDYSSHLRLHGRSLSLSKSLMIHVQALVKSAVINSFERGKRDGSIETIIRIADTLMAQLSSNSHFNSSNRKLFEVGTLLVKALVVYPVEQLEFDPNISLILSFYESHLRDNNAVFETITKHHSDIAKNGLSSVQTESLISYANAAELMGSKAWVAEANKWIQTFAISFFRRNGARKVFIQKLRNKSNNSIDEKSLPKDLLSSDISMSSKIRILDVGSCYNPIAKSEFADAFDITAIDLYPADESVMQCNFLDLEVRSPTSSKLTSLEDIVPQFASNKTLKWLPEASFDAVSMSLVLSYLPTPAERLAMVRKARKLLVSPGFSNQPHRAGILLIVEKVSIFGKEYENDGDIVGPNRRELLSQWKQAISGEGFELLFHRVNVVLNNRRYHAFAFATSDIPREKPCQEVTMWMKQDFHVHDKDGDATVDSPPSRDRETNTSERMEEFLLPRREANEFSSMNVKESSMNKSGTKSTMPSRRSNPGSVGCLPVGIVGGGLGGSALAVALQNQGIPFVLFEKDDSFHARRQGYALTMQQGGGALKTLGLGDAMLEQGAVSTLHSSFRWDGQPIGAYGAARRALDTIKDSADVEKGTMDISYNRSRYNVHIPRQKLRELLIENIAPDKISWSKKLTSFERVASNNSGESVLLRFNDASEYNVSLLVGADGVFSSVYQLMLQRNEQLRRSGYPTKPGSDGSSTAIEDPMRLKYLGLMVILGISPLSSSLLSSSGSAATPSPAQAWLGQRQWLDGSTRVFTMPFDATKTMWQLSFPMDEGSAMELSTAATNSQGKDTNSSQVHSATAGSRLKWKSLEQVRGWAKELVDLIESTEDINISGHPVYDRDPISPFVFELSRQLEGVEHAHDIVKTSTLCTGLVTLLGDAAHPMSPFKGQGANQALVDAVQLCNALTTTDYFSGISKRRSVESALRDYEKEMCKRSSSKVMKSREAALLLHQPAAVLAVGNITRAKAAEIFHSNSTL